MRRRRTLQVARSSTGNLDADTPTAKVKSKIVAQRQVTCSVAWSHLCSSKTGRAHSNELRDLSSSPCKLGRAWTHLPRACEHPSTPTPTQSWFPWMADAHTTACLVPPSSPNYGTSPLSCFLSLGSFMAGPLHTAGGIRRAYVGTYAKARAGDPLAAALYALQ